MSQHSERNRIALVDAWQVTARWPWVERSRVIETGDFDSEVKKIAVKHCQKKRQEILETERFSWKYCLDIWRERTWTFGCEQRTDSLHSGGERRYTSRLWDVISGTWLFTERPDFVRASAVPRGNRVEGSKLLVIWEEQWTAFLGKQTTSQRRNKLLRTDFSEEETTFRAVEEAKLWLQLWTGTVSGMQAFMWLF